MTASFRLAAVCLLVFTLLTACSDSQPSATPTTAGATSTVDTRAASPTATPASATPTPNPARPISPAATPFSAEERAQAMQILEKEGELRGAPALGPVDMYFITRQGAVDDYEATLTAEDRRLLELQSRVYGLLGMIPDGTDYLTVLRDLLRFGLLGYYDPDIKAFFLLDDLGGVNSRTSQSTIVHELAHALQDQYYDLNRMSEARIENWDASFAFVALVEGNAIATESGYYGRAVRPQPSCFMMPGITSGNPPYTLVRELNAPYDDGVCFLNAVAPALPDQNRLFERTPASTEEILHPEKFLAGEAPVSVPLPSILEALGAGWTQSTRSTLGEFSLQNLLIQGLGSSRQQVQAAAAGWGGDSWAFYESPAGDRLFHGDFVWDTPEDATQFWTSLAQSLEGRGGQGTVNEAVSFSLRVDGKAWLGKVDGSTVTLLIADNISDASRAASAAGLTAS